eukprot:1156987-Pelagomonas_calceolata.AAC.5
MKQRECGERHAQRNACSKRGAVKGKHSKRHLAEAHSVHRAKRKGRWWQWYRRAVNKEQHSAVSKRHWAKSRGSIGSWTIFRARYPALNREWHKACDSHKRKVDVGSVCVCPVVTSTRENRSSGSAGVQSARGCAVPALGCLYCKIHKGCSQAEVVKFQFLSASTVI